uniref:Serine/threonine-protein phosphatase 1 regulatory subunit 10 n=1 Tax=Peronospora matthiolae TaxID=2874970 RepID=A0AAV1V4D9_9STRA
MTMNIDMEQTSFTSMLESTQFGGALQVPQQSLMHPPAFGLQDMLLMGGAPQFMKQQQVQSRVEALSPASVQRSADQQPVPNVLQNMMSRSKCSKLIPSSVEASLLSLVDGELRVSLISNLPVFLKILPRCKTEPEQTLALVVLRATSTATDTKLSRACACAFEKAGGLRLARTWVDSAVTWQHDDMLVLLLEVLQTLPLQLSSITEARINEPIVKLRKNAREERVKRAAQDLLKFWRGKFTEKEKSSASSPVAKEKGHDVKPPSSATSYVKQSPSTAAKSGASSLLLAKQAKALKKRTIKRLERLPFGGGSAVSKSSDLIGNLMQRKSAKDAAAAAEVEKKVTNSTDDSSSTKPDDAKKEQPRMSSSTSEVTTNVDDALPMSLPTIQSFKAASSCVDTAKESKCIRWADESGEELVQVKLIESWRDLVPYDPRHDDQSFKDAKLREHANERHALHSQHHRMPPAVSASQLREWTTPAFMRLPEAVAARVESKAVTDEMHVQDSRRRHVDEYEVLMGEMPIPSPKEWERGNEPQRGPPLEIPLSDVVESEPTSQPPSGSALTMAPVSSSSLPNFYQEPYPSGGYSQAPPSYDHCGVSDRSEYNGQDPEADRKLREALGPLQGNTISLLLDNPDVVPQVYEEAQRNGNRIPDVRVFEIVDQYRRARYQAPPNVGGPPSSFSPYGGQQQQQQHYGNMGPGAGYGHPYQQPYLPPGGSFMPGKRKAIAMGVPQNGGMLDASSLKRPAKKNRGTLPCRYFASPTGCKHGGNCHYAHVQSVPSNGPEYMYNNRGPMMGGRGGGHMEQRYGPAGIPLGAPGHHMRGGR